MVRGPQKRCSRVTDMQIHTYNYTNTVWVKFADRPNMCYIFENVMVRGPQKQCSQVSEVQLHKYSLGWRWCTKVDKKKYHNKRQGSQVLVWKMQNPPCLLCLVLKVITMAKSAISTLPCWRLDESAQHSRRLRWSIYGITMLRWAWKLSQWQKVRYPHCWWTAPRTMANSYHNGKSGIKWQKMARKN